MIMRRLQWMGVVAILGALAVQSCGTSGKTQTPTARLTLSASPTSITSGQSTTITVRATNADESEGTGTVTLTTNTGGLSPSSVTLASGQATATFTCDSATPCSGQAVITGSWGSVTGTVLVSTGSSGGGGNNGGTDAGADAGQGVSQADGSVTFPVGPPQSIGWVSTTCNGQECRIMGLKGTGVNEQAQITFRVEDASNNPTPNIDVTFSLVNAPLGTSLVASTATTNTNGVVVARVVSGGVVGAFNLKATVASPPLSTVSPTIGVRGAKPSNHGFSVKCEKINYGVYTVTQPPGQQEIPCNVGLADRFNNPVGTGTSVYFKTEAGSITNEVATQAYDPDGANELEGVGSLKLQIGLAGTPEPVETTPLTAIANQWPYARSAEWSETNSPPSGVPAVVRNPRDRLVTLLAYTQGEEFFWDEDADGIRDSGERFIDQGEPFVDANDNNIRDVGEFFIDADKDGVYDPPNGTWDGDTTIWTEKRVILTGFFDATLSLKYATVPVPPSGFATACPGGLAKGATVFAVYPIVDNYLNVVESGSSFVASITGKGTVAGPSGSLGDSYGFGYERRVVDATSGFDCTSASTRCLWKVLFYDWGLYYSAAISGALTSDTSACENGKVSLGMTVRGQTTTFQLTGGFQ